ncbi:MAG: PGPGW domain-containing protein [Limisphaerales bacterium]
MPRPNKIYRRIWSCARWLPRPASRPLRRVIFALLGGFILLTGLLMIVLPGPAVVVIPLGVVVLASEFTFMRRWLRVTRRSFRPARTVTKGGSSSSFDLRSNLE